MATLQNVSMISWVCTVVVVLKLPTRDCGHVIIAKRFIQATCGGEVVDLAPGRQLTEDFGRRRLFRVEELLRSWVLWGYG